MKKKSAKLLSKLSMQSNDNSLVKSLVTDETANGVEAPTVQIDEKLGLDLESALDLKNFCSTNQLMDGGLVDQKPKYSMFINESPDEVSGDLLQVADESGLNDWFDNVQIRVDLEDGGGIEEARIVENIRKKLMIPTKSNGDLRGITIN